MTESRDIWTHKPPGVTANAVVAHAVAACEVPPVVVVVAYRQINYIARLTTELPELL